MPYLASNFWSHSFPYVIAAAIAFSVLRRNLKPRKLNLWTMCISPILLTVVVCGSFAAQPTPTDTVTVMAFIGLFALGGVVGWQRGRMTRLTIHPVTGEITAEMSMWGGALLILLLGARYLLRDLAFLNAGVLGLNPVEIADGFLLFALGMVIFRPAELVYRAIKLRDSLRLPDPLETTTAPDPISGAPAAPSGPLVADTIVGSSGRRPPSDQIVS
ncbi:MAG: hypothetical protein U1E50_02755 [Caulobacteraceae bacterium]